MEPNESSGLNSYYHSQQPPPPNTTNAAITTAASPTNGISPNAIINNNNNSGLYSHAVPSATVSTPLETVKRKRGRPRKYSTPEQAAAAKRLAASNSSPGTSHKKKDHSLATGASASKKSQLAAIGNSGQGFILHFITVNAGEDVGQKIMFFMQQSKREVCVLSACGSVSNASLSQPATSGGSVNYEGRFNIITLSGSYVRTEFGGRTGGLSVCLSSSDGQVVGGGVGGPLIAAGPIQVMVGSFTVDAKDIAGDSSANKMQSPVGLASVPGISFRPPVDTSHQNIGGGQYMTQHRGMNMTPSRSMEWRDNTGHGVQQSPENGDYDHIQD